jgi:hypothetical protein
MAVAILFAVDLFRRKMDFHLPEVAWQKRLTLGLTALVFCYPLISIALGRPLQETIVPGTLPCPTTALALVLLSTSLPRVDRVLYALLLFWAIFRLPPLFRSRGTAFMKTRSCSEWGSTAS